MNDIANSPNSEDFKEDIPIPEDPLLERMKRYILDRYEPVTNMNETSITMSTTEIFESIGSLYRNEVLFSKDQLARWLDEKGFRFIDMGKMRFEWMLKKK